MLTGTRKANPQQGSVTHPAPLESLVLQPQRRVEQARRESHIDVADFATSPSFNFGDMPVLPLTGAALQAKLTIGQPNDKFEQEADRVADTVIRMPTPAVQREQDIQDDDDKEKVQTKPLPYQITSLVQRQSNGVVADEEEENSALQARIVPGQTLSITPGFISQLNTLRGRGQALDTTTRAFMEPRFGHGFGQVRVHTDQRANYLARSINARAFTVGRNMVFGAGQYQPQSTGGRRLVAHELTHTLQQSGDGSRPDGMTATRKIETDATKHRISKIRSDRLQRDPTEDDAGVVKGAAGGLTGIWKHMPLPEGFNPSPTMNARHVLANAKFFKAVKPGAGAGNSYLLKNISPSSLYKLYLEAAYKGVKDGFVTLSNGQTWYIRASDGKFFPSSGKGIIQLTQQEVRLLELFVQQAGSKGNAQALSNLSRAMAGQKYSMSAHMEMALNVFGKKFGITEKAMVQAIASQIKEVKSPPSKLVEAAKVKSAGRGFRLIKFGGRILLVIALAADAYEIYEANFAPKVITKKVGAWAGSLGAGGVAASEASPLLAGGPWGWAGYVLIVGGAGIGGYFAGGAVTETIYEWVIE